MAEGVGFEPTVELPLLLISSQMPLTTQPPFHSVPIGQLLCGTTRCFCKLIGAVDFHGWQSNHALGLRGLAGNGLSGKMARGDNAGFPGQPVEGKHQGAPTSDPIDEPWQFPNNRTSGDRIWCPVYRK